MSRAKLPLLSLLALLFILGACQSEGKLEGEVFIVTEGRENIEMGLVEVKAIEVSAFDGHLKERHSQSEKEVRLQAEKIASLLDSLSSTRKLFEKREAEYEEAQSEHREAEKMFRLLIRRYSSSAEPSEGDTVAADLGMKVELYSEPNPMSDVRGYMKDGEIGKVLSIDDNGVVTSYKIRTKGDVTGWTSSKTKMVESKQKHIRYKTEKESALKESKSKYKEASKIRNEVSKDIYVRLDKIQKYRSKGYYFEDTPKAANSDETGSEGRYELTVTGGTPYYIVAQASRSVGDEGERYYWMVETTVSGGETKEVNLSNDNLGGLADRKYALNDRTLSTVRGVWESAISLAKEGEEMDWEKLIYRTAFPEDTTDVPIPDDLDVPEEELLSNR